MDKATYTLLLDFGSGWEDFTEKIVLQEGYVPRSCIGREGKHEIQTVALKIHKGAGLSARLVQAENDIPAKLLRNGIVVLRGIVRPYTTSRAVLNRMDPVTLSILDMSATLEQYVFDTQYWTNLVLINRTDVSVSLIHRLFAEAGVEASDVLVDFDRIEQIPHYALSNGEYISDRIQEALYEYGLTYRATSDGKFRILDISPDAITPEATIGTAQLRTEFSLSRNDSSQKGAIVKWYPVLSKADAELFLADEDGQTIASGAVYPNGADADGYRLPYDISEYAGTGKLLSIENPRIAYTPTSLSVDVHAEFGQDDCSAYLISTSTKDQTITRFAIIADIRYKGSTASQQVVQGTKPKTYTAKVISDAGSALRLARILASRQTVGKQAYGFDSPVQFQPGTIVRVIEDKVSHMDVTVRITSCEYSVSTGLYAYVGEGVADIDLTTTVERIDAIENALGKPRKGRDGAKGDTGATGHQGLQGLQGVKGDQGIQGPTGSDGLTAYNHIAYADSATGSGFSQSPTGKAYIGFYADHTAADSTDATKYQWSLIKGADGAQGIQGPTGADGQTSFFHTAWANSANGATGFSTTVSTGKLYIGVYSDHTASDSTNYASYSWTLIKGEKGDTGATGARGLQGLQGTKGDQGIQGPTGSNGLASYNHIAYADNSSGGGFSQSPTGKAYIGFYSDHTATDSTDASKYLWSLIKGADGAQGIQGPTGTDGQTSYFHTAWANSANGATGFSTTVSTGKLYIGVYSDHTASDSTNYASYSWTLIKGEKGDTGATGARGLQGLQGTKGDQGIQGPTGSNGLASYNHIAYADNSSGGGFSQSPTGKAYIGFYSDHTATDSTDASKYLWSLIKGADGAQGIQGPTGADGQTSYFHTAWANSVNGATGFSTTVSAGKLYIGVYSDHTAADSTNYASYSWTLIKGEKGDTGATGARGLQGLQGTKGDQGIQGPTGSDGLTAYNHIAYADSATGSGFSQSPTGKAYIGFYADHTAADSTDVSKYQWSLIKGADGAQGIQGPTGADGQTSYFHTAWANSANGATDFSTTVSAGKLYIGVYSDHTAADSTNYASYSWTLVKGEKGDTGATGPTGSTGASAKDFTIFASPATYALSSRGKCLASQTVTLLCNKLNIATSVTMGWTHSNGISLSSTSGSPVTVTIPAGSTLASFSVTCTVMGYGTKTVTILGVKSGEAKPMYLGVLTSAPGQTSEGPLFGNSQDGGDFYLDTGNIPHWYNGTSWNPVDKDTPNYSQIMGAILGDVFNSNTMIPVSSAVYGFFKSLAANDAFLKYLQSLNLLVGNGNGTDGSGFRFRARSYDSAGNYDPLFDIFNGSKQLFKVDVSSGKIYFGKYFWYDPADGAIHTPGDRLILNANGQIDGDAIQVISTLNAGFLQPWEVARFPNTSPYILDFINETPLQMASKLDALFATYASYVKPSFSPDPDLISSARNGMIMFYCVSGNNSTMQLYNSATGIVDVGMSHYVERYAVNGGFRYEIGAVTKIRTGIYKGTSRVYYNNFLSYIESSDSWTFPIDPFRDFTTVRILGITSYTDIIGDLSVNGEIISDSIKSNGNIIASSVSTTYGPNKPVDNNDASAPAVGPGGFTFCISSPSTTVKAPPGGTYMYIRIDYENGYIQGSGRIAGGDVTHTEGQGSHHNTFFWRLS